MREPGLSYFPKTFSNNSLIAYSVSLIVCSVLFFSRALPLIWVMFSISTILGFFIFTRQSSVQWRNLNQASFSKKLFRYSLAIRLIWVFASYFFYIQMTGKPFEFNAADSTIYHQAASNALINGINNLDIAFMGLGLSDQGFPFYLSMIYFVVGDYILIPRILNAILGAFTVILIYRLAIRNFGQKTAYLAGIIAMLMPNLIYYCGLHLKETLMVFILVAFIERSDMLLRKKNKITDYLIVAMLGASLFFFRTVLLASALFALFSMVLFIRRPGSNIIQRMIIGFWIILVVWFTFSYRIQAEFEYLLANVDAQEQNLQYKAKRERGNTLAAYGSSVIFAPFMFVAPFPTLVNIEHQQTQMMLSGGYYVKNVLAFFVLISIISFIRKRQLRKYILILSFILAYLAILAQSSFALSERFHLPAIPFLIILAAYGITQVNKNNQKLFIPYLIIVTVAIIGWNVFKLAGRGMI